MISHSKLKISSEAFEDGEDIPSKYTCEGENFNPPLKIENMPEGTQTVAIIMEDPDAPAGTFNHWLVWNIPPNIFIEENRPAGISGKNSAGKTGYHGPCPPSGSHRYYFHIYALDAGLNVESGINRKTFEGALKNHVIAKGSIMGRYRKQESKQ